MSCDFCELYKDALETNEGREVDYQIKLVENLYNINGYNCGTYSHRPLDFKFCPQCGKELKESEETE